MDYHADHTGRRSVYYDDTCSLCEDAAKKIRADIDLDTVGASDGLPEGVDRKELMREVIAMDESGELHRGIDAVILILSWHPQGRYLAPVLALPGIKQLGALVYRIVAANRHRWFKKKQ